MSFIKNKLEDYENFLQEALMAKHLSKVRKESEQLDILRKSVQYMRGDIQYLFQEGFVWDEKDELYTKDEDIDYGEYPGKYKVSVSFPQDYPQAAPDIYFEPLFKGKSGVDYSKHINDEGHVCIAKYNGSHAPNSYWESWMNARGALILAYSIITEEYKKKEGSRRKIPIKKTIFESISKVVGKDEFIREFMVKNGIKDIDRTFTWEELAFKVSQEGSKIKSNLVSYYNLKRKKR